MNGLLRHLVVDEPVQFSPVPLLEQAAPLLEEERYADRSALIPDGADPIGVHGPGSVAALATHDHPADAGEVNRAEVLQQRLDGEEPHPGRRLSQMFEPGQTVAAVLHADS